MGFELVDKELALGAIAGSDYGSQVRIMARSPTYVLFNALGCQSWDRGDRSWHSLKAVFRGRPTIARYEAARARIDELFGAGATDAVIEAWKKNKTVWVDGGGDRLPLPNHVRAEITRAAYDAVKPDWRADLSNEIKRCKQCGSPLRPDTDHHHFDLVKMPNHPRTAEECQRLTNQRVIAVHGYGTTRKDMLGLIHWFETWDGERYQQEDFCSDACAATYGRRAAAELPLLEPGGKAPERAHRIREDVDHYDVEAAEARRREQIARMFPKSPPLTGIKL